MSTDIQKVRSPNSPKIDLESAIALVKQLHEKIGRSQVKLEVAMGALGYKGVSGASLTTIGAISQYGLIDRSDGNVSISPLAIKMLHPTDEAQKASAIKEAALKPKIFSEIYEKWNDMAEDVLANNLIHQSFTVDGARRSAAVYKANYTLAKLGEIGGINPSAKDSPAKSSDKGISFGGADALRALQGAISPERLIYGDPILGEPQKVLATFKIPLGLSEAELTFTGERLELADFDALLEYVGLFKKQYERKLRSAPPPEKATATRVYPAKAEWKGKTVSVLRPITAADGARYFEIEGEQEHPPETVLRFL